MAPKDRLVLLVRLSFLTQILSSWQSSTIRIIVVNTEEVCFFFLWQMNGNCLSSLRGVALRWHTLFFSVLLITFYWVQRRYLTLVIKHEISHSSSPLHHVCLLLTNKSIFFKNFGTNTMIAFLLNLFFSFQEMCDSLGHTLL